MIDKNYKQLYVESQLKLRAIKEMLKEVLKYINEDIYKHYNRKEVVNE